MEPDKNDKDDAQPYEVTYDFIRRMMPTPKQPDKPLSKFDEEKLKKMLEETRKEHGERLKKIEEYNQSPGLSYKKLWQQFETQSRLHNIADIKEKGTHSPPSEEEEIDGREAQVELDEHVALASNILNVPVDHFGKLPENSLQTPTFLKLNLIPKNLVEDDEDEEDDDEEEKLFKKQNEKVCEDLNNLMKNHYMNKNDTGDK